MTALSFEVVATAGRARRGLVRTTHGSFETPAFMPVGTAGTVKALDVRELHDAGAQIVLANTYHLALRPGSDVVAATGGLHRFMGWSRPILTDSGGFQVMSLSSMRKIGPDGVSFRSHLDGRPLELTPERAVAIQAELGSDIAMVLDVCPAYEEGEAAAWRAVETTTAWAKRSLAAPRPEGMALFGIVQGGAILGARLASLEATASLPFDGLALGSLMVGEPKEVAYGIVDRIASALPPERPRYVMGVGTPADLVTLASLGVDMFDTVLPTRNARNGMLFTSEGKLVIKNARHARDESPPDPACGCPTCTRFSRAYLRHLYLANEVLSSVLMSRHNVQFFLDLMGRIRDAIAADQLDRLRDSVIPLG